MDDRQVLAAYDDSPASHAAVQWAAAYAENSKRPLFIALADDVLDPDEIAAGSIDESAILINGVVAELRSEHPNLPIETIVADEPPVQLIERLGDRAALVVLGTAGGSRVSDAILGSAAYRIAADARCPVVLISAGTIVWPPVHRSQKVVVGASDSANGAAAVRFAVHYAAEVGGLVTIVRGCRVPCSVGDDHAQQVQNTHRRLLDDLGELGRGCSSRVEITTQLVRGSSEQALRIAADGADLLVVGRRSSSKHLAGWTSLAARVAARPPCPVAIVGDPSHAVLGTAPVLEVRGLCPTCALAE